MTSLVEDNSEIIDKLPDAEYGYKFFIDDQMVGIASINKNNENKVFIFIKKELRGNGYGKMLFSEIIKELNKKDYKEIKVEFSKDNIQMQKIIMDNGGLHLSTDKDIVSYLVPIKN